MKFHGIVNPEDAIRAAQNRVMEELHHAGITINFIINTFEYEPLFPFLKTKTIHPEYQETYNMLSARQRGLCFIVLAANAWLYKNHEQAKQKQIIADISDNWQQWIEEPMLEKRAGTRRQSNAGKGNTGKVGPLKKLILRVIESEDVETPEEFYRALENDDINDVLQSHDDPLLWSVNEVDDVRKEVRFTSAEKPEPFSRAFSTIATAFSELKK